MAISDRTMQAAVDEVRKTKEQRRGSRTVNTLKMRTTSVS